MESDTRLADSGLVTSTSMERRACCRVTHWDSTESGPAVTEKEIWRHCLEDIDDDRSIAHSSPGCRPPNIH